MKNENELATVEQPKSLAAGVSTESARAQAEIQAALVIAQANPRDEMRAMEKIEAACGRMSLASRSEYRFSRGGQDIAGASIHLMKVIACAWGNVHYGVRILNQSKTKSECEAYAWDVENNVREVRPFTVRHVRDTRSGSYDLSDQRDIYELQANFGARRLRSCLEGVIPRDVVEEARLMCLKTVSAKWEVTPDRIKKMLAEVKPVGITRELIEAKYQRKLEKITPMQMVDVDNCRKAIEAGMGSLDDYFKPPREDDPPLPEATTADKLAAKAKGGA